jgi:hypothetical protein
VALNTTILKKLIKKNKNKNKNLPLSSIPIINSCQTLSCRIAGLDRPNKHAASCLFVGGV